MNSAISFITSVLKSLIIIIGNITWSSSPRAEAESMRVALLENIQRENLDPIEEAEAYKAIMDHYGASHGELAAMLGKSRPQVSNMLRLLRLETTLRELVQSGVLSMGHARALLGVEDSALRLRRRTRRAW